MKALTAWKRFRKEVGYGYRMDSKELKEKEEALLKELEKH